VLQADESVFEVMLTAKKCMSPIFLLHPNAAGTAMAVYVQHWRFNPSKNALILDSKDELGPALTSADRRAAQVQLEELIRATSSADTDGDGHLWASLHTAAEPLSMLLEDPLCR